MAWLDGQNTMTQAGLNRHMRAAARHLRARDTVVAGLIDRYGPCRFKATRNYFQVMLETIVSQQLSTLAARSIYRKLIDNLGGEIPRPAHVLAADESVLRAAGLSRSKAQYVRNVAEVFSTGRMGAKTFAKMTDEEVYNRLTAIKGVGRWSADMFLMFALNRLDVFPIGDLGLRKAMYAQYGLRKNASPARLERIADNWRPYRTVGSLYMWRTYDGA